MKQKIFFMSLIVMITILYSCKKNKETDPVIVDPIAVYPNFSQLKVGNYWIYQQYSIDSIGVATPTSVFDSCYVEKDTVINSKTYFKMVKPRAHFVGEKDISFQRDSLECIVNLSGRVLLSSENFFTILESRYLIVPITDTVFRMVRKMTDKNLPVVTSLGTFITSNAQNTYFMYPKWTGAGNPRYENNRYSVGVGIVIETLPMYSLDPKSTERRLVKYHVN